MQNRPKNILVVINEIDKIEFLLSRAILMCKEHQALLEILFVHEDELFSLPEYFYHDKNTLHIDAIKKEIETVLDRLKYTENYTLFVEDEDTLHRVQMLAENQQNLMILSAYHEGLSLKLARELSFPMLIIKTDKRVHKDILYLVDLNTDNKKDIAYIQMLFPKATIRLLFEHTYFVENYVYDTDFMGMAIDPGEDISINQEIRDKQRETFEILKKETNLSGDFVEELDEDLGEYINTEKPDLLILHGQNESFLIDDTLSGDLLGTVQSDILVIKVQRV